MVGFGCEHRFLAVRESRVSLGRSRQAAAAIMGLFVLLSTVYSLVNPIFEAPDEVYHYPYTQHLAAGNGLPVQRVGSHDLWEQEGSQPPLYYVLSALLTCWIDASDLPQVRWLNPYARIGVALARDNKNMVVHTEGERWPWRGTVLAIHLIRFFSVVLGACTLWGTWGLARVLFPERPDIAIGAMLINALNPMFLFISGSVNNDNLVILLSSLTLLLLVRMIQRGRSRRCLFLIGITIGLACLSKLSGLALLALAAFTLASLHLREVVPQSPSGAPHDGAVDQEREPALWRMAGDTLRCSMSWRGARALLVDFAWIALPTLVVAGWWYARNWYLYGEPLGISTMLDVFGRRDTRPSLGDLWGEFEGFRISYWGLFGVVNVLLRPHWLYKLLDAFSLAAIAGFVQWWARGWWRRRRRASSAHPLPDNWLEVAVLLTWTLLVCLSLLRWTSLTKASQGRLVFPAISVISLFLSAGLLAWFRQRQVPGVLVALAVLFGALAISAPIAAIRPAYAISPILRASEIPASAHHFDATYGGQMRLLAYDLGVDTVAAGDEFPVTLYWEALAPMSEDYSVYVHLFGREGQRLGQRDSYTGGGTYPTSHWSPGEIASDTFWVPIRQDALGPVAARVEAGLYRRSTMAPLAVTDAQGRSVGSAVLGRVKVTVPAQSLEPSVPVSASFDDRAHLYGYDLEHILVSPGSELSLNLYWEVLAEFAQDYTVFVHLVSSDGDIVGQGDGPPLNNDYPTSFWEPHEMLLDRHKVLVSDTARAGPHSIWVGLYDPTTGQRMPALSTEGQIEGDGFLLAAVTVQGR